MPAISHSDMTLRFNRGKYDGAYMHLIVDRDPAYITWCWEKSMSADKMGIPEGFYHAAITHLPKTERSAISRAYLAARRAQETLRETYANQPIGFCAPIHPNCRSVASPVHLAGEWAPEAPEEPSFLDELAAPKEIKAESFLDGIL